MEYKSAPSVIKSVDGRSIVGIFAVHGNIDSYNDISYPGSFAKTIAERGSRVKFLWNHDFFGGPPIAKITNLREIARDELPDKVLTLAPNATGGVEVTREYLKNDRAEQVFEAVASGASDEMSYGYDAIQMDFNEVDGKQVRNLREIRLWEVSDVIFGANPATAGSKLFMPLDVLVAHLDALVKAGARHSESDAKLIDNLHDLAAKLGARTCKGILTDDDKSKTLKKLSELRPSNTRKRQEPVAITGLWLRALGNSVQACVEIDEEWRLAIDEMVVAEIEGIVSHICEPLGMRNAPLLDDTGKSDQSRAESSSLTLQARHRLQSSALALFGEY